MEQEVKQQEVKQLDIKQRNVGFYAFFFSGICSISSGIVVSLLQEKFGFAYGMTGTLLSIMSIGNLMAGFAAGVLPGKMGMKKSALFLAAGYALGYMIMAFSGWVALLVPAFFLAGMGKGSIINFCTIFVGNNSENRTKGMNMMHSCYACGALLCPFVIAAAAVVAGWLPMAVLGVFGIVILVLFASISMESAGTKGNTETDWSFLRNKKFWLLTGLLFCQNAAETSVTGWMVTYFKGSGILSGTLSTYTVTVMWFATLVARMLIAFVFPVKHPGSTMIKMGIGCTVFYFGLMMANTQVLAILLLFAFSFSMAGMNPTAVASAGRMTNVTSMGVMLPAASAGAIIMPWIIGIVAEHAGLGAGMACNIAACAGMLIFSIAVKRLEHV